MTSELNEKLIFFVNSILENVYFVQFVISIAGILVNIPHLFILFQSSMRISSTNTLMIGIALCDLTFLLQIVHARVQQYWLSPSDDSCFNFNNYYYQQFWLIGDFLRETCEKASFWMGVFLALTRFLIMKLPGNAHILSKPLTGYLLVILVLAVTSFLNSYYYIKLKIVKLPYPWKPGPNCKGYSASYTEFSFFRVFNKKYDLVKVMGTHVMISGISRILISVTYPVLAIFLIIEIRKSAKFVSAATLCKKSSLERHRTGRMILVMTVFYVIASAPGGVSDFVQLFVQFTRNSILLTLVEYGSIFISGLFCLNAASHSVINFTMSSKYRTTVKKVLGIQKKEVRVITVTNTKSSPSYPVRNI